MKIRVKYRNGRLQVVDKEVREDVYDDLDYLDMRRSNWTTFGVDPIRSMIRGHYDGPVQCKQFKK